jgi:MFS family permease
MRIMQGAAIGGEAPGAWVFVAEHARRGRAGFALGLLTSGLSFGILLGSLTATSLSRLFSDTQITAGAWRIPFLIAGVFGFIATWLRRWLKETPVFEEMQRRAALSREFPLGTVLRSHVPAIVTSLVSTWMLTAAIVVVILMTPSLAPMILGLGPAQVQTANLAASATLCISTLLIGAATDRFGVRRVAVPMLLLLIASTYGLYLGAKVMPGALLPLYALAGFGAGASVLAPIMMIYAFPPSIRFSGVSFCYNVGYAVFGGLTPLLVTWLVHLDRIGPAHYVAAVTVAGLAATLMAPSYGAH